MSKDKQIEEDGAPWLDWGAPEPVTPYRDNTAELEDMARQHLEGYGQRTPLKHKIVGCLYVLSIPVAIVFAILLVWAFLSLM